MTTLHERRSLFAERNLFVHAVLGLIVTSRKVRAFIERHLMSPPDERDAPFATIAGEGADTAPAAVYAVLGALSFMRTLDDVVQGFIREGQSSALAPEPRAISTKPGDLLR